MPEANLRLRLRNFFRELKRRKVIRAAIAYVVVGAGVAEGAVVFLPPLGAPVWLPDAIAVLVVLGFPVAMVLSWLFDIVPEVEVEAGADDRLAAEAAAVAGSSFRSATRLEGQRLLHYDILERLGVGGMGVVYKARDTRLDRIVAIKVLSDHLLADADAAERFLVEARAAAALDHPNICAIHEVGETEDERFYIAMQYYEGDTLRQRIDRGTLQLPEALDIAAQICRGLEKAAGQEIIHRDIKPANIILTEDGIAKIVDFGLAKYAGTAVTQTGARIGTVAYMSPEQTRGDKVDERTDIWSLGVVLYEMLSGARPFRGGSDQAVIASILEGKPESLTKLEPSLPASVISIVERAMHRDPGRRYATASSVLQDLEQVLDDPSNQVSFESTPSLPSEGERRRVTVIACAIEGFDSLLEKENPDDVEEALAKLERNIQSVLEEYGGELNEFSEDSFVALFGVPISHEDDRLRAVRAALEIRDDEARVNLPAGVQLRIAAGSEQVPIRATESGKRRYRIGGTVVRDTSRLAALAAPGEILLPPKFARIVEPFVATEGRAPVNLVPDKPAMTPVAVMGESGHDSRLEASAPGSLTEFVGRDHERNVLLQALQDAEAGNGRFVTVIGDIGVGKSRLLYEFWKSLKDMNVRSTVGRCREQGGLTPLLPFIAAMRDMLGLSSDLTDNTDDEVVARTLELAPELEDYLPAILHVLSIGSDKYPLPDYLEGEDLQSALGEALISVFTQGASGEPLVMLLEDWHWADESSKEVLQQLRELVAVNPLLVVVTSRPGPAGDWPMPTGDVHLELTPLGDGPAVELMRAALNGARIPAELSKRIGEKTGGNPFFIEELCRTLLETEALVIRDGEAQLVSGIDRLLIPDTVEAVLKSRLDRLDPEAREVLRCAAVIGPLFGLELLKKVVPSRSRVDGSLETLRAVGLIQRTGLGKEPTYRFKHALTRDVTYDSLLERQRKERHALVGAAIEELYGDSAEEYAAQLAVHFAAAEDWDKAISYGLLAAKKAESLWRLPETVEVLSRTRTWIEQSDKEPSERTSLLTRLLFDLERYLEFLGRPDEQQKVIDDLSELIPTDVPAWERGEICVRQSDLLTLSGRFAEARPPLDEALHIADQLDDLELRGKVLRSLGHLLWLQGDSGEAVPWLQEAVNYSRAHDNTSRLITDLQNLGRALKLPDDADRAMAIGDEALAVAKDSGILIDQSYVYHYKGHLLRAIGRTDDAIDAFEEAARLARKARMPVREVFNTLGAAALYLEQGQLDKGLEIYEESVQLARRANRVDQIAHALVLWAEALVSCGKPDDAIPQLEEAVSILRRIGNEAPLASALVKLAHVQQRCGRTEASATWRQSLELHERLGDQAGTMEALERLAGLQRGTEPSDSDWLYRRALAIAADLEDRDTEARIRNSLGVGAWQAGDLDEAEKQYRKAATLIRGAANKDDLGVVLNALGAVLISQNQEDEALAVLNEALATNRESGQDAAEADSLAALGAAARAAGKLSDASAWYQQCVEHRRALGDRAGEGWALQRLSEVSREAGESQQADAFAAAALAVGREIGDKALESVASALQSADSPSGAD